MILNLVDRCAGGGIPAQFEGDNWRRLGRLAAGVGGADWAVDVVLVTNAGMADLNQRFRETAGVTDVLSFSYLESAGAGAPDLARGERYAAADIWLEAAPDSGDKAVCGELVLAPAFIAAQGAENGWLSAEEIPLLVVHGCLHLLGWDHQGAAEQQAMQDHEVIILAGEGLSHPLRQRS